MSWSVHYFLQNHHMVPKVYALLRINLDLFRIFNIDFHLYAQTVLWGL